MSLFAQVSRYLREADQGNGLGTVATSVLKDKNNG
ncbi:MAG: hypothetical protein ACJAVM_000313 [Sulfitobacter sp.]|jgi:hypothetical protein